MRTWCLAIALLGSTLVSNGSLFVVTNTSDSGTGTLREAISQANAAGEGTISFQTVEPNITLTSPLPQIQGRIEIDGSSSGIFTLKGGGTQRVISVQAGAECSLVGLQIVNTSGLENLGLLSLRSCIFSNNARFDYGGAVSNAGSVAASDCVWVNNNAVGATPAASSFATFSGNPAGGGAIYSVSGKVACTNCTFNGNAAIGSSGITVPWPCSPNGLDCGGFGGSASGGAILIYPMPSLPPFAPEEVVFDRCVFVNNASLAGYGSYATGPGGGGAQSNGGALWISGGSCGCVSIILKQCTFVSNRAIGGNGGSSGLRVGGSGGNARGGALWTGVPLVMENCTVTSNAVVEGISGNGPRGVAGYGSSRGGGAWVYLNSWLKTNLFLVGSTFVGNAAQIGGGVYSELETTLEVNNCTFWGNTAQSIGGAIYYLPYTDATLTLRSCTVVSNYSTRPGQNGALTASSGMNVGNCLVAGNVAGTNALPSDVLGFFTSSGYNLIGAAEAGTGFTNGVSNDQVGTTNAPINPRISPLRDNGGPTWTAALLPSSPAIDVGSSFGSTTDQRGRSRPYDHVGIANATGGDGSDIGAFEITPPALTIARVMNNVRLSWPIHDPDFILEAKSDLSPSAVWFVPGQPVISNNDFIFTDTTESGNRIYRLRSQ